MQPWEIPRIDVSYPIRFYGRVENIANSDKAVWSGGQEALAVAYDTPIPGYGTKNCANIRLWKAVPQSGFDLNSFNGMFSGREIQSWGCQGVAYGIVAGNYEASVAASSDVGNIVSPPRLRSIGRMLINRADSSALPERQHVAGEAPQVATAVP